MAAKFTVSELARMMNKPPKEVLFLLQGIGVDVKSVESVLDPGTAQAILTGKTQAPKTLIVRQTPAAPPPVATRAKTERAALKRIKIVEKPAEAVGEAIAGEAAPEVAETVVAAAETAAAPAAAAETEAAIEEASAAAEAPAREPVAAAPAEEPVPPAPVSEPQPERPRPAAAAARPAPPPSPVETAEVTEVAEVAEVAEPPKEAPSPAAPAAAETQQVPPAAPEPAAAAAAAPARHPATHPPRAVSPRTPAVPSTRRPGGVTVASPATLRASAARPTSAAGAPARPAAPGGALGRLLRRGAELPPRPSAMAPASAAPAPPAAAPPAPPASSVSPAPGTSPVPSPAPRPAPTMPAGAPPSPTRGVAGLGRAVIAPPSAATTRAVVRPSAPPTRPPIPARPGMPARPGLAPRPGMPVRPGGPGSRPDGVMRPGFGRGPLAPTMPPPAGAPGEKRRKDATKPAAAKKEDAKKAAAKKPRTKEVSALEENVREYLGTYQEDTYEDVSALAETGEDGHPVSKSAQRRAGKKTIASDSGTVVEVKKNAPTGPVFLSEGVTVKELSEKTGILAKDLMKSFLSRGILATINHPVEPALAVEIAKEFGIDAAVVSFEEDLELTRQQALADQAAAGTQATVSGELTPRAPVVTVMGHVDHGKTSLLDAIRHANVAAGEAGGITQHIGAYRVEAKGRPIVFLDTPGHEAFTMMRARGAKATDIVVLVVAADDGVMPQTVEAIDHARAAKVPIVVAVNKIDKPEANPGRVKQALAERGVVIEEFGGEVVACEISAKKRIGIESLLEMILLQAELLELKAVATGPAKAVVLEARREVGKGTLATVLVQQGTLRVGDFFFAGAAVGRVRAMLDDRARRITEAGPATPVEVMGFEDIPNAGDTLQVVLDEADARRVQTFRVQKERDEKLAKTTRLSLDSLFNRIEKGETKELALIVKADVHGSEEVLVQTLNRLSTDKVKVTVVHSGVGAISLNDVHLAQASEAIVIGFNVRPEKKAEELAEKEGVDIRLYSVIYTVTDEIKKAMMGLLDTVKKEIGRGKAEVRNTFRIPKIGVVAGCMVVEGVVPRNASARLVRDGRVIFEGKIGSLRRFKEDTSEVKSGFECGIGIAGYQDIKVGDVIEAFVTEEVAPSLT